MDKAILYKTIVRKSIEAYARLIETAQPKTTLAITPILDDTNGQYVLLEHGWRQNRYVRNLPLHIAVKENKIWIEEDLTETGIATYFLANGVPKDDIVFAIEPTHYPMQ